MALGGVGMTMEDLIRLYAMFGNGGRSVNVHWSKSAETEPHSRVISRSAAWQIGHILASLAPPHGAPQSGLAYKTGQLWPPRRLGRGYDGRHVGAVWMGRADGTPVRGRLGGACRAGSV